MPVKKLLQGHFTLACPKSKRSLDSPLSCFIQKPNLPCNLSPARAIMRRSFYFFTGFLFVIKIFAGQYDVPGTNITLTYLFNEEETVVRIVTCNQDAAGHLTIPATLEGKPVQVIGDSAFRYCTGLTGVTFPDSITHIEKNAFVTCSGITSMNAPESLISLGAGALTSTSVTFYAENNLKYFMNSSSAFLVDASNASGDVIVPSHVNGLPVISANGRFGGSNITSVTIPGTVTEVGDSAFFGSSLSTITLAEGVNHIRSDAFKRCASLQQVNLPTSLRSIGHAAFAETTSLYNLVLPEGLTEIGTYAFSKSNIKTVDFPDSLTIVGDYAFNDCIYLKGVDLSNTSVAAIGRSAFDGCRRMTSAVMGDSVISIGGYAFRNAHDLASIDFGNSLLIIKDYAFSTCDSLLEITLPDSLVEIKSSAFRSCRALSTVNFGTGITRIGLEAFKYCRALNAISLPNSLTELGVGAFSDCSGMTSVEISNQLTTINYETFLGCAKIESIVLPQSVTIIEGRAFLNCSALTNITFGSDLDSIGDSAFWNCKLLAEILIPNSVTSIGEYAFGYCSSLTSITLPQSISSLESGIFEGCSSLQTVIFDGNNPTSNSTLFNDTSDSLSVVRYENATGFGPTLHGRSVKVLSLDGDDDLDGNSNQLERLVGTNPFDAASKFSIWLEGTQKLHFTLPRHEVQIVCLWSKKLNSTTEDWNELAILPSAQSFALPSRESSPFKETEGQNIFFKLEVH